MWLLSKRFEVYDDCNNLAKAYFELEKRRKTGIKEGMLWSTSEHGKLGGLRTWFLVKHVTQREHSLYVIEL